MNLRPNMEEVNVEIESELVEVVAMEGIETGDSAEFEGSEHTSFDAEITNAEANSEAESADIESASEQDNELENTTETESVTIQAESAEVETAEVEGFEVESADIETEGRGNLVAEAKKTKGKPKKKKVQTTTTQDSKKNTTKKSKRVHDEDDDDDYNDDDNISYSKTRFYNIFSFIQTTCTNLARRRYHLKKISIPQFSTQSKRHSLT
jgi:hypothetical protein